VALRVLAESRKMAQQANHPDERKLLKGIGLSIVMPAG